MSKIKKSHLKQETHKDEPIIDNSIPIDEDELEKTMPCCDCCNPHISSCTACVNKSNFMTRKKKEK